MLTVKRKKKHLHLIKSGELNCQSPGYRTVGPVKCYYRGEISETLMPGKSQWALGVSNQNRQVLRTGNGRRT